MSEHGRRRRKARSREFTCVACSRTLPFCWSCPCGFLMCQECMEENMWGMSCNQITWTCPDCGEVRSFGNQ